MKAGRGAQNQVAFKVLEMLDTKGFEAKNHGHVDLTFSFGFVGQKPKKPRKFRQGETVNHENNRMMELPVFLHWMSGGVHQQTRAH